MATEPRIPLPEPGELRADAEQLVAAIAPPGREPAKTMAILAYQPDLLSPFLGWAAALALNGVLSKGDHELLALRVASNYKSEFEWVEHVEYARDAGLTEEEITAAAEPVESFAWSDPQLALLHAADDLHKHGTVNNKNWANLAAHFDKQSLVEILFVIGQYASLSMVANAAGI